MSINCHPFDHGTPSEQHEKHNCCEGGLIGEKCSNDIDCQGKSYCADGSKLCVGESMCSWKCNQYASGKIMGCCTRETSDCKADLDCVGMRSCRNGQCHGNSGCEPIDLVRTVIAVDDSCQCRKGEICKKLDDTACSSSCSHNKTSASRYTCSGDDPSERKIIYDIGCQCDTTMKTCEVLDDVSFSSECYAWRETGGDIHCTLKN
jgi:hypothetical protein